MRWAVALVLAAAALGACGAGSAGTAKQTALTITYWENGIGKSTPVRWTLRCTPARGTLARPAVACRRLAGGGVKLFAPIPPSAVCTQIYGGPQVARVVGAVAGKRIWTTFTRTDGCQLGRWNGVSPWLLPPGGVTS